jgi:hypothetical protein
MAGRNDHHPSERAIMFAGIRTLVDLGRVVDLAGEVEALEQEAVLLRPDGDRVVLPRQVKVVPSIYSVRLVNVDFRPA